jgi:glyoxylase-like metal-dependent hydrolase (beta-lactamase superfamily II)
MKKLLGLLALVSLSGCSGMDAWRAQPPVQRMYVIDCGENHVKDLSRWTPGQNVGKPFVFGDYCYLIKHAKGWMLWDSGIADRVAAMPHGLTAPNGAITATRRRTLVESLKEIGVEPADIRYFAMSHSHADHAGNASLFVKSVLLIQGAEYAAAFGPEPQKYGIAAADFEKLRGAQVEKLNGDYDVFGDGSVVIKSTPGHTPGHQSLLVRLPKRGPVLLTGDVVHLVYSWEHDIVPGFNFDQAASRRSIAAMKQLVKETGAQVWVNHDREQHNLIPKSPNFVE